jgi:hypothetical protein
MNNLVTRKTSMPVVKAQEAMQQGRIQLDHGRSVTILELGEQFELPSGEKRQHVHYCYYAKPQPVAQPEVIRAVDDMVKTPQQLDSVTNRAPRSSALAATARFVAGFAIGTVAVIAASV